MITITCQNHLNQRRHTGQGSVATADPVSSANVKDEVFDDIHPKKQRTKRFAFWHISWIPARRSQALVRNDEKYWVRAEMKCYKKKPRPFLGGEASWAPSSEPYPCNICRNNWGILLACADMDAAAWDKVCFEVKIVTSAPKSTSVKVARDAFVFSRVICAF